MKFNEAVISELTEKYNLPEWIVKDEIEKTVSLILTKELKSDIVAMFNGAGLEMWRFDDIGAVKISLDTFKLYKQKIKQAVTDTLLKRSFLEEYALQKTRIRTVVYGRIIKVRPHGEILVEILDIEENNHIGVCDIPCQPPSESGKYKVEDILPFYILRIEHLLKTGEDIPKLEIRLSRNSKGLTEELLKKELIAKNLDIKARCIRRIAGAFSEIKAKVIVLTIVKIKLTLQFRLLTQAGISGVLELPVLARQGL